MEAEGAEYGFRVDAFELCCQPVFREDMVRTYLRATAPRRPTFLHECCLDSAGRYNHYGYYNNFFAVKLALYRRPEVRARSHIRAVGSPEQLPP